MARFRRSVRVASTAGVVGLVIGRRIVPWTATIACVTVAAVILAASPESALGDVEGTPRVRRLADVAWAGGAVPVIVVAPAADGRVEAALAGAPATWLSPAPDVAGPIGQILRGIDAA